MLHAQTHNDEELFKLIAEGDEDAFRSLYFRYQPRLKPFLTELTHSSDTAADLIQETMLRVWFYREKLATVDNPQAYIYRMAANRAHSWLKKQVNQTTAWQDDDPGATDPAGSEQTLIFKEISMIVQKAISELPDQRKRVYLMNREQGMKAHEIAQALQLSVSTVKNTLLEAVKFIRQQVEKAGYFLPLWWCLLFF